MGAGTLSVLLSTIFPAFNSDYMFKYYIWKDFLCVCIRTFYLILTLLAQSSIYPQKVLDDFEPPSLKYLTPYLKISPVGFSLCMILVLIPLLERYSYYHKLDTI